MNWECHNCGEQHDSLPAQCRSCGTAPEIVENVWRCNSCGESGIGATRTSCPSCGAEKGSDAKLAVDASRRIEGERGRALLEGVWRYCAYCKTQVPPVNQRGVANEDCPTCGGPLSESKEQAARETLSAEAAARYRPQKIVSEAVAAPHQTTEAPLAVETPAASLPIARPPKSDSRMGYYVFAFLGLFIAFCRIFIYEPLREEQLQVSAKRWQQSIVIESMTTENREDWAAKIPAEGYDRKCETKKTGEREVFDREEEFFVDVEDRSSCLESSERQVNVEVPDGEESYTEQEQVGKTCKNSGFVTNGGVSVKKCLEWEPRYQEVTKTRTKYRQAQQTVRECSRYGTKKERRTKKLYRKEPILEDYCRFRYDVWQTARTLTKEGTDENPQWPEVPELAKNERVGDRQSTYAVTYKAVLDAKAAQEKNPKPRACQEKPCERDYSIEKWKSLPVGKIVRVAARHGYIERFLEDHEKP